MMAARRDKWIGFLCLGVTVFGWALNWPLMKFLLQQWPPLFSRGLAGVASALILFSIAKARGQALELPRKSVPRLLFASFTNVFAWMGFSTVAMKFVPVGQGTLIVYTMPIWATLLAWPLAGTRPTLTDIAALALGVGGLVVLLGGGLSTDGGRIIGIVLLFSAAILFAIGNILNGAPFPMPPLVVVAWQVGLGCLMMLFLGIAFEQPDYGALTAGGLACQIYMTLVPMGICYLTWFETLRRLPPASASTGMLLVPLIGVISGALILGEPLGLREVVAMALVLGGVTLALQRA